MGKQTALANNSTIWSMRNSPTSPKLIYISKITFTIGYSENGTPDSCAYGLHRFSGGTPSGGSVLTPAKGSTKGPNSFISDARQSATTSLTMTGVTVESTPLLYTMNQRNSAATTTEHYSFVGDDGIILYPGEGLCIRLGIEGALGDYCAGSFIWSEQ